MVPAYLVIVEAATMTITSSTCSFVKPAAMNESSSCSLKCPRFSISVLARVESAANRLFAGACPSRIPPVCSELTPCWSASAVWKRGKRLNSFVFGSQDSSAWLRCLDGNHRNL